MRIAILSDLHLEFAAFDWVPPEVDAVILAGDVHTGRNGLKWILSVIPRIPVIYVLGNHEYYGQKIPSLREELKECAQGTNVRVLENEGVDLGDVAFLGTTLWTDLALYGNAALMEADAAVGITDFRRIRLAPSYRRFLPRDSRMLHAEAVGWLTDELKALAGRKIVVVTHHAPSARSISPNYAADPLNPCFASNLDQFVAESGAKLWVHGHIHHAVDYQLGTTRVICNPRGYPNESVGEFNPGLIAEI